MMCSPLNIRNTLNFPNLYWHPSVVLIPSGFGGHKWWMAQSPYHPATHLLPYNARYELPCIHYSDNGSTWKSIKSNPIDDLPPDLVKEEDYLSDPHLVYKDGILECYYRLTLLKDKQIIGNKTLLLKKTSQDGETWSDSEIVVDLRNEEDIKLWGEQIISQSIIWTGTEYICWYVDGSGYVMDRKVRIIKSTDGKIWERSCICTLNNEEEKPWHIDVQQYDGVFHLLSFDKERQCLTHYTSMDGINFTSEGILLRPSSKRLSFYSKYIYRACSVKTEKGYRIFFSAGDEEKSYIGALDTRDWHALHHVNVYCNHQYFKYIIKKIAKKTLSKASSIFIQLKNG